MEPTSHALTDGAVTLGVEVDGAGDFDDVEPAEEDEVGVVVFCVGVVVGLTRNLLGVWGFVDDDVAGTCLAVL